MTKKLLISVLIAIALLALLFVYNYFTGGKVEAPINQANLQNNTGFHGPTGPPHIKGPTGPPPSE